MLRGAFISLSKAQWAQRVITRWRFAWRVASRFVAGETAEEALQAVQQLNQRGINATLDHLGENTTNLSEADQAVNEILRILEKIDCSGLKSNISIKLTQLGLALDPERTYQNLLVILEKARELHNFVRIDMEDSSLTQATLNIIQRAWEAGFRNTGAVIQAYLYRSEEDVRQLVESGIPVRLVKGAYKEPASLAYPRKRDVDRNFDHLSEILIEAAAKQTAAQTDVSGRFPPLAAVATHDEKRIRRAAEAAQRAGLAKSALEFQMLYGIRRNLQRELADQGYPVRVYIPNGTHWYPYFMRRLAERPANVWFFVSSFFQR